MITIASYRFTKMALPPAWLRCMALGIFAVAMGTGCATRHADRYPIGIYAPGDISHLDELRQAGFSHVTGPARREFLDAARAQDLEVLTHPGSTAGPRFDPSPVRTAAHTLDSHPALWAWYLSDEPDLNDVTPEQVDAVQRTLRTSGARKPTALVVQKGPSLARFHGADILMVDRYPIGWQPLATFFQHMQHGVVAARAGRRSFISVIQAFDWGAYADIHPFPEPLAARPPTEAELRCMAWGARLIGADGLFFYAFDDGRWSLTDHPDTWRSLQKVVGEIRRREPLFTAARSGLPPRSEYLEPSRRFNEAFEPAILWASVRVQTGTTETPPGLYWILVNTTAESHQIRIRDTTWHGAALPDCDLGAPRQVDPEGWMEELRAYEVRLLGPLEVPAIGGPTTVNSAPSTRNNR
jgi:hypothetical protein